MLRAFFKAVRCGGSSRASFARSCDGCNEIVAATCRKQTQGRKELAVSLYQTCVLLLFNDVAGEDQLDYGFIKESTGLGTFRCVAASKPLCALFFLLFPAG